MSDTIQNLISAVDQWRGTRSAPTVTPLERNPYGAKIYAMNMEWAEIKDEHERQLDAKRTQYQEQVDRLHELSARWKAEHPEQTGQTRGRPKAFHSDEIKRLAAKALREGTNKTTIRALLGVAGTEKLNGILAEGEALLKAEEG
jgi:hypothetical protein